MLVFIQNMPESISSEELHQLVDDEQVAERNVPDGA